MTLTSAVLVAFGATVASVCIVGLFWFAAYERWSFHEAGAGGYFRDLCIRNALMPPELVLIYMAAVKGSAQNFAEAFAWLVSAPLIALLALQLPAQKRASARLRRSSLWKLP